MLCSSRVRDCLDPQFQDLMLKLKKISEMTTSGTLKASKIPDAIDIHTGSLSGSKCKLTFSQAS
jgi:hypothetical protein